MTPVKAILFDVFGTVVDWRTSVADEGRAMAKRQGIEGIDWDAFADAWRAGYHPAMDRIRLGEQPWTTNDRLHRERLDEILDEFGITGLDEDEREEFNCAWHRLTPWPDSVLGLALLKSRYTIGTLSNGSYFLLANMAKHSGLPWDCILSADNFRHFKPDLEVYRGAIELFGGVPGEVMLCAAHNGDLAAARSHGMKTAFVPRPTEYGPDQITDLVPEDDWDIIADGIEGVAEQLGVLREDIGF